MVAVVVRDWWELALRGVVAILFGIATIVLPGASLLALVLLFGAYAFADGLFNVAGAWRSRQRGEQWGSRTLSGVLGVAAGVVAFVNPGISALALVYLIAAWAVVTGTLTIVTAFQLRDQIQGEWLLGLGGLLSVILGVLIMAFPQAGALAIVLWVGAFALVSGATLLFLGLRLRSLRRRGGMVIPLR